jgi:hypothetical protein
MLGARQVRVHFTTLEAALQAPPPAKTSRKKGSVISKKKDDKRGQIPRMRDLTIEEQDILMQRWKLRNALRTAQNEVIGAMLQWVIDDPDIEIFVAKGHFGLFDIYPARDLFVRMAANGFSPEEIEEALKRDETPISWMAPELLIAVDQRITLMDQYFATHAPGTFEQA